MKSRRPASITFKSPRLATSVAAASDTSRPSNNKPLKIPPNRFFMHDLSMSVVVYEPAASAKLRRRPSLAASFDRECDEAGCARYFAELREKRRQQGPCPRSPAARHEDVLLAPDRIAYDSAAQAGPGIEGPQHFSV